MEYMDGGSLDLVLKKAGKIPEPYSRKIIYAVGFHIFILLPDIVLEMYFILHMFFVF